MIEMCSNNKVVTPCQQTYKISWHRTNCWNYEVDNRSQQRLFNCQSAQLSIVRHFVCFSSSWIPSKFWCFVRCESFWRRAACQSAVLWDQLSSSPAAAEFLWILLTQQHQLPASLRRLFPAGGRGGEGGLLVQEGAVGDAGLQGKQWARFMNSVKFLFWLRITFLGRVIL